MQIGLAIFSRQRLHLRAKVSCSPERIVLFLSILLSDCLYFAGHVIRKMKQITPLKWEGRFPTENWAKSSPKDLISIFVEKRIEADFLEIVDSARAMLIGIEESPGAKD